MLIREAMVNASIDLHATVVDRLGIRSNIFAFVVLGAFHHFGIYINYFFLPGRIAILANNCVLFRLGLGQRRCFR
jgi:hypothetical protein